MADTLLANSFKTTAANTPEIVFIADAAKAGALMSAVTASNNTSSTVTYKLYIGPTTPVPTDPILPARAIDTKKTDIPPEVSGQVVLPGEALWLETSIVSSIALTVTGRNQNG